MLSTNQISVFLGTTLFIYRVEVKDLCVMAYEYFMNKITNKLIINVKRNEKIVYAIKEELNSKYEDKVNKLDVINGVAKLYYKIGNGQYNVSYNNKTIYVNIEDDKIILTSYFGNINTLKSFVDETFEKFNTIENVQMFYTSIGQQWETPIFRRPRKIIKVTNDMQKFMDSTNKFFSSACEYEKKSYPYKKGYLIVGEPGTGKTTAVEKMAIENSMPVYIVNLNSDGMTDSVLINLLANVPIKSIILFDEMDKQYDAIKNNKKVSLSTGGILSALDGIQRLSHGTIVVIIANNIDKLDNEFKEQLIRPGRIDETILFTEKLG